MGSKAMYCRRCNETVAPQYDNPRMRKLARVYFLLPLPFVPLLPIIASDYFVMIPLTMAYMLGVGPALSWVTQRPTCPQCDAFVEPSA